MGSNPTFSSSSRYRFKGKKGGEWDYGNELMKALYSGRSSLKDESLQADFLDWILTDKVNVFRNRETRELAYALVSKRGNSLYAAKKNETLNEIIEAANSSVLDFPVDGLRDSKFRQTKVLFFTLTFSHKRFTPEEAWSMLRATPIEDCSNPCGILNKFGANITSIFGGNGKLTCKEGDSHGYPAPHVIVILDHPVLVKRHIGKDGTVSWRLADKHFLQRVGKDVVSRSKSWNDVEAANANNPIWPYGLMDVQGIVKDSKFGRFSNGFTYLFKYLIKTVSLEKFPQLNDLSSFTEYSDKSLRTMMFTHLGNKCFRTRDIVFGKAFKDRLGILKKEPHSPSDLWERLKTIPEFLAEYIQRKNSERSDPS